MSLNLTAAGLADQKAWEAAGYALPSYDREAMITRTKESPCWVHFGAGNIFRAFQANAAQELLNNGTFDRGVIVAEGFDTEIIRDMYQPHDNLSILVTLKADGSVEKTVVGSIAESLAADTADSPDFARLKEIFTKDSLQMATFTITEKGYSLKNGAGELLPSVAADFAAGPSSVTSYMGKVASFLYERFLAGEKPVAMVSTDNCSHNGEKLSLALTAYASAWEENKLVQPGFLSYLQNPEKVSFPWTMIDKITPRPSEQIAADLEKLGVEDMQPVITGKKTYIAPFVNAEKPQYLVIEDSFPNGRPALEKGFGVYMADRNTVNLSERMKVTVCLNPVHSATGPLGVVLGYDLFAHMLNTNEDMMKMARMVAYDEGLPVVADPGILSPQAFVDELFNDRFPNEYLGDTNLRLAVDVSQMVGIRFGETVKAYVKKFGDASRLTAIPLGIAGWLRYMLAVDDEGNKFELAPDPMNEEITEQLGDIVIGKPETFKDQLKPILSNERLFFTDLYKDGVGEKIEDMFREMIAGPGAVKATIHKYVNEK